MRSIPHKLKKQQYSGGFAYFLKSSIVNLFIQNFSTRQPVCESIRNIFRIIGKELNILVEAERVYHFFTNPELQEIHLLDCNGNNSYELKKGKIKIDFDKIDIYSWLYYSKDNNSRIFFDKINSINDQKLLSELLGYPNFFIIAPFCQDNNPFGYFIFEWHNDEIPELFTNSGNRIREDALQVLKYVKDIVSFLFTNHYTLFGNTYLPTFMKPCNNRVAVLFADIRNFTNAFSSMRHHNPNTSPMVGLVKAYLATASEIIAQSGIGRIDKFIGDGIMATFGEHLICKDSNGYSGEENRSVPHVYYLSMPLRCLSTLLISFLNILRNLKR